MTINWRQRAPILRVLAAVYAELGEEAFKGRYGRIAKLYGNEATYDAIKSFFAKEIVKMAEELKAVRNVEFGDEPTRMPRGQQRSGVRQRPVRLDFDDNDDDIILMGEREVQMDDQSSHPAARAVTEGRARSESLFPDARDSHPPTIRGFNGIPTLNPSHLPSATPGPSSRTARPQTHAFEGASPRKQSPRRKRPYSAAFQEPADNGMAPSFGYVTNQGKHRCALCTTELPSAEVLRKHESMSKLHFTNLKDPVVVSRGCVTLAQVTSLAESAPRLRHRPLNIGGSDGREDAVAGRQFDQRGELSPAYGRSGSLMSENENENDCTLDTIHVAQPRSGPMQRRPPPPPHPQRHLTTDADSRDGETGPAEDPDIEVVEQHSATAMDKGKRRAQTDPRDQSVASGMQVQSRLNGGQDPSVQQEKRQRLATNGSTNGDMGSKDIPTTLLAQILLSNGMELLAKKCIEEHPELSAGFFKCMREMQGGGGSEVQGI